MLLPIVVLPWVMPLFDCTEKGPTNMEEYLILLSFKDQSGDNLFNDDIIITKSYNHIVVEDKDGWSGDVSPDIYKLYYHSFQSKRLDHLLCATKIDGEYYLVIDVRSGPKHSEHMFYLTSPTLFRDESEHTIVTCTFYSQL